MILPIYVYGSRILHQRTTDITEEQFQNERDSIRQLIADMLETMVNGEGIGLAANQVGRLESIIVLNSVMLQEDGINLPSVLLNPHVLGESKETTFANEGCLSFPDLFANINRAKNVIVEYRDEAFEPQRMKANDLASVVLQHEIDHLRGMTFNLKIHGIERRRLDVVIKQITRSGEQMDTSYPTIIKK